MPAVAQRPAPAAPVTPVTPVKPVVPAPVSVPPVQAAQNRVKPSFEQELPPKPVSAPKQEITGVTLEPGELFGTGKKMDMTVDWSCFRCGRTNASYVTTCACGVTKRRAAIVYEKGVDPYAAQEEEEKKKQAERDKAMEAILEQKNNFGPKMFDSNVIVEVETVSRQSALERKMTNALYNLVDKASAKNAVPEKEDRLSKYAEEQNIQKAPTAAPAPAAAPAEKPAAETKPSNDREPFFDEWKCPDCGTINNDYVSTCACGCSQRRAKRLAQGEGNAPISRRNSQRAQQPVESEQPVQAVNAPTRPTHAAAPVTPPPFPSAPKSEPRVQQPSVSVPPQREIPPSPVRAAASQSRTAPSSSTTSVPSGGPRSVKNNDREPYFDEWKCPECGTINNDYVTACSCGCTQRRAKRLQQNKKK